MMIALSTTPINAQSVEPSTTEEYLDLGIDLSEQDDFIAAIEAYTQAIKLNTDNALAYYNRGLAFYHLGNHTAALTDFHQTIKLRPDVVMPYRKRGLMYLYLRDYQGAIADFEQAARLTPDDPHVYLGKAAAQMLLGNISEAMPDFERAIALDPDFAIAYFLRGGAYSELGEREKALQDYQQAGRLYRKLENRASFERIMAIVRDLAPNCYPNCNRTGNNDLVPTDNELLALVTETPEFENLADHISFGSKILVLGENPDILGIIGPFSSDAALVAGETYRKEQLVAISPTSTSVKLSNFSPYFFRTAPNDTVAARALVDYAVKKLKAKRIAIFFNSKSGYSQSLEEEFLAAISQRGGSFFTTFDLSDPNFNATKSLAVAEKNGVEVLMLAPDTPTLDQALEVVAANRKKLPILGGDAVLQAKTRELGQENAVGMVVASPWFSLGNAKSNFLERARSLWGEEVGWRSALAYDATQALITAIQNNPTRTGVQQALTQLGFKARGASGNISFLPSGDRSANVELVQLVPNPSDKYGYSFVPLLK